MPVKTVFVSHGWGPAEHEAVLDAFVTELRHKLHHLPQSPPRAYTVDLWFDRDKIHARSGTFADQTLSACRRSDAILLMMSDKFHASQACRDEVACFRDATGAFRHDCAVKIQHSGRRQDGPSELVSGPVQPELFDPSYPTLLALWSRADVHRRDEFLLAVRDDLLAVLDR